MSSCDQCTPRDSENICFVSGATYKHQYIWLEPDGVTPVPNTGYQAKMQFREREDSQIVDLELNEGSGITLGGSNGIIDVLITPAQSATLTKDKYVYDLRMTSPSGEVTYIIGGNAIVTQGVTQ